MMEKLIVGFTMKLCWPEEQPLKPAGVIALKMELQHLCAYIFGKSSAFVIKKRDWLTMNLSGNKSIKGFF